MKKLFALLFAVLLLSVVSATIPIDSWDYKDYYNITNVNNLDATPTTI